MPTPTHTAHGERALMVTSSWGCRTGPILPLLLLPLLRAPDESCFTPARLETAWLWGLGVGQSLHSLSLWMIYSVWSSEEPRGNVSRCCLYNSHPVCSCSPCKGLWLRAAALRTFRAGPLRAVLCTGMCHSKPGLSPLKAIPALHCGDQTCPQILPSVPVHFRHLFIYTVIMCFKEITKNKHGF